MSHVLILGMTESGKTTLARNLARYYKRNGVGVLALDPLLDPRWQADFITDDSEEFLEVFWGSRRCAAFMDEGGESVGRYDIAMQKTATRGRHWGHACHFIAQKASQLAPIVRDQCSHLFLFCSSVRDGKILADEFNQPALERCTELKQGQYIHAVKFGGFKIHGITGDSNGSITHDRGRADIRGRIDPPRQEKETRNDNASSIVNDSASREGGNNDDNGGEGDGDDAT